MINSIYKLYPQVVRTVGDEAFDVDGNLVEIDPVAIEAYEKSIAYVALRQAAHLPIPDQLDMQYHDAINGTTKWLDYVTAIKTSIPKELPNA